MAKNKPTVTFDILDPSITAEQAERLGEEGDFIENSLIKSIVNNLDSRQKVQRLAFEEDPSTPNKYSGLYYDKFTLLPDRMLKRLALTDGLVAAILQVRSSQVAPFGRPLESRFGYGYRIEPKASSEFDSLDQATKEDLQVRIKKATKLLATCGHTSGLDDNEQMSLSTFLSISARNGCLFGRFATEIVKVPDRTGKESFHSFRPVDAGTIYKAIPNSNAVENVRKRALVLLEQIKNEKLKPEKFKNDEYSWVQAIDGKPVQAFSHDELHVYNRYPVTDIELNGYPLTPLDTAIAEVVMHINITSYNRMYFQTGRASKGMLVINSDDIDASTVADLKQQFNAQINSVSNSFKMPVFKVGVNDKVEWRPIDSSGNRDMEFQFLSDNNARAILSAFQMSPDEIPGYNHLSKGTNAQGLCLHPDSKVFVPSGLKSLNDILATQKELDTSVWTGLDWVKAKIFRTGIKSEVITRLDNGIKLKTSPDHRFRVIGNDGKPTWKPQKDLKLGDTVLVNKIPVVGTLTPPSFNGRQLTVEMMEVLGWLTGDGNINLRFYKDTKNLKQGALSWFYHHEKEIDIWNNHEKIMRAWGLDVKHRDRLISEKEAAQIKSRKGVKTVAPNRITNRLYNTEFVNWLLSLGFTGSSRKVGEGKVIPPFIHSLPVEYRSAFLKGFFSSDGTLSKKTGAIRIVIHDDRLREQTKELLLGLGIRTQGSEGIKILDFGYGNRERLSRLGGSSLSIKDKFAFFERVGFLQKHKQPTPEMKLRSPRWERAARETQVAFVNDILNSGASLSRVEKNNLCTVLNERSGRGISAPKIRSVLETCKLEIPSWLNDYYFEPIVEIKNSETEVEMVDVTVYDNNHAFVANGMVVHNSESSNEFRLEAARDSGIRPLLSDLQSFLNSTVLPLVDEEVAKYCVVRLQGLDADNAEKERTGLTEDMPNHGTYDEWRAKVEKSPLGKEWGGEFPFNQTVTANLDKYFTVGQIKEHFFGVKDAAKDPRWDYCRDPFYFQNIQLVMQQQQMQQQQQMAQQQMQAQAQQQKQDPNAQQQGGQDTTQPQQELDQGVDKLIGMLSKSEKDLDSSRKLLVKKHNEIVKSVMDSWEKEAEALSAELSGLVHKNKKN